MGTHRQTKATNISQRVKETVWERDGECCIICGSIYAAPEAHYVPRSSCGLGVEQNIVTLCRGCHDAFHQEVEWIKLAVRDYLKGKYPDWDESKLHYKKYNF